MKKYLTAEEFEQKIKDEFDNLTEEKFNTLLLSANIKAKIANNDFIFQISKFCMENNTISFKQYKAMLAFISDFKKKENTKSFNKAVQIVSKPVSNEPTITNYNGGGWKSNGKYQQPIKHKLYK